MKVTLRIILLLAACQLLFLETNANEYAVANIADSLRQGADVVLRNRQTTIEITDIKKAVVYEQYAITILNDKGKDYGHFAVPYSPHQNVKRIRAEVLDAGGKRIHRVRRSEINDRSLVSNASLFEDRRMKYFEVHQPNYPYTLVVEYEVEYDGYAGFNRWIPQYGDRFAVEQASLKVILPEADSIRHKTLNMPEPVSMMSDGKQEWMWELSHQKGFRREAYAPPMHEYLPVVFLAPYAFYYHNTSGNLKSWSDYGDWVAQLLFGRQKLPEHVLNDLHELIADVQDDPREKARRIYQYMQGHTRYVSIQLGIGGFQPFPAEMVVNTGYGDCKALSNYTMALMRMAGVEAYYAEIGVGAQSIYFDDFPSLDQTNHAILCLPFEQDTVWLECTSQHLPFGHLPRSLQDRKALVVKAGESEVIQLPTYQASDNSMRLSMDISINGDGDAQANLAVVYKGAQTETIFPELWQGQERQLKAISSRYGLPGLKIHDFNLNLIEEGSVFATEEANMDIRGFAARTGNRMFIDANPLSPLNPRFTTLKERLTDFELNYPYLDSLLFTIKPPKGYQVESLPDDIRIESDYGFYQLQLAHDENVLQVSRILQLNKGRFPAEQYNDYVMFRRAVNQADRNKIVLLEESN